MSILKMSPNTINNKHIICFKMHTADSWMSTTSHIENQERQPLYPPPLVCLDSPNQQSSEASALDLAIKNRNGSSTSTPIESNKVPSLGGLIRPIPSRLGSPFSPILSSGVGKCPVPSHIMAKILASSAVNPYSLSVLGNSNVTTTSKLKDAMETRTNNSQKLSLESGWCYISSIINI